MIKLGFLEKFNIETVAGWVPAEKRGEPVRIVFNGQRSITVGADIEREDIGVMGYGFSCPFPFDLLNEKNVKVSVYFRDQEIANSPRLIITDPCELQKVLYGKDGWLFLTNDTNESLGYLTGHKVLDDSCIRLWVNQINQRFSSCKEYGMDYYHLIVPEKEVVYSDKLPDGLNISSERPVVKLLNSIDSTLAQRVIYPDYKQCDLQENGKLVYSKGDTHWTHDGAYYAVNKIIDKLSGRFGVTLPSRSEYLFKRAFQASDLLIKTKFVNVEAISYATSISKKIRKVFDNETSNTGRRQEFVNFDAPKIRLMCWHTSSVDWMMPFLNDVFGSICYIWGGAINWDEVLRYRPDIVLFQSRERFLTKVPNDV